MPNPSYPLPSPFLLPYTHKTRLSIFASLLRTSFLTGHNQHRFGPTFCGEWSQADTDCARHLNNVGVGARWTGTLNTNDPKTQVLSPTCPVAEDAEGNNAVRCECDSANADPARYSPQYKQWLQMFAEAQMHSFEKGWGWFYWTWETERSVQWSWKLGREAGILPQKAYAPAFRCEGEIPSFQGLPESY